MNARTQALMRWIPAAAIVASSILSSACGTSASGPGGTPSNGESSISAPSSTLDVGPNPPPPDWDNPTGDPSVADAEAAEAAMPMAIIIPQDLKGLVSIHVSPADRPPPDRVASFVYDDPNYGRVIVEETTPQVAPDEWTSTAKSYVSELNHPSSTQSTIGTASLVDVRGNTQALATTGDWGDIQWLDNSKLELHVLGPKLNSLIQLQDIADGLGEP
jgi:hypothetical protein